MQCEIWRTYECAGKSRVMERRLRRDEAKDLASQFNSIKELVVERLARMELPRRDRTATHADLESHLNDSHTLTVLCSGFNNAPAAKKRARYNQLFLLYYIQHLA